MAEEDVHEDDLLGSACLDGNKVVLNTIGKDDLAMLMVEAVDWRRKWEQRKEERNIFDGIVTPYGKVNESWDLERRVTTMSVSSSGDSGDMEGKGGAEVENNRTELENNRDETENDEIVELSWRRTVFRHCENWRKVKNTICHFKLVGDLTVITLRENRG